MKSLLASLLILSLLSCASTGGVTDGCSALLQDGWQPIVEQTDGQANVMATLSRQFNINQRFPADQQQWFSKPQSKFMVCYRDPERCGEELWLFVKESDKWISIIPEGSACDEFGR